MRTLRHVACLLLLVPLLAGCISPASPGPDPAAAEELPALPAALAPYEEFRGEPPDGFSTYTTVEAGAVDLGVRSLGRVTGTTARLITDGGAFWVQLFHGNDTAPAAQKLVLFTRVVNERTGGTVAAARVQTGNGSAAPVIMEQDAPFELKDPLAWELVGYEVRGEYGLVTDQKWRAPLASGAFHANSTPIEPPADPEAAAREELLRYWGAKEPLFYVDVPLDRNPRGSVAIVGPSEGKDTFDELEDDLLLGPWQTGNYTVTVEASNFFVGSLFVDFTPSPIRSAAPNTTRFDQTASNVLIEGFLPLEELAKVPPGTTTSRNLAFTYEVDFEVRQEPAQEEPFDVLVLLELGVRWRGDVFVRTSAATSLPVVVTFEPAV